MLQRGYSLVDMPTNKLAMLLHGQCLLYIYLCNCSHDESLTSRVPKLQNGLCLSDVQCGTSYNYILLGVIVT